MLMKTEPLWGKANSHVIVIVHLAAFKRVVNPEDNSSTSANNVIRLCKKTFDYWRSHSFINQETWTWEDARQRELSLAETQVAC